MDYEDIIILAGWVMLCLAAIGLLVLGYIG
jgi:hypothetical protein